MKLYYAAHTCALLPLIVLEELQLPYTPARIRFEHNEQRTAEFLALNAQGRVPVLVFKDGDVLTESVAIATYLARTHPAAGLLPLEDERAAAHALEQLLFCATTLHPAFASAFRPERLFSDPQLKPALRAHGVDAAFTALRALERRLPASTWILGAHFSLCDAQAFVYLHWARLLRLNLGAFPRAHALFSRLQARPSVQRAMELQQ